jgi:mRNA interferase MazF
MPTFERGQIVRVPFPYTDRDTRQHRPALVVSDGPVGDLGTLLWVIMITSAENRRWPGDVSLVRGYRRVGLPAPSLIRTAKIATIEGRQAEAIGKLDARRMGEVDANLGRHLGLRPPSR